jgi:hypothetical protein
MLKTAAAITLMVLIDLAPSDAARHAEAPTAVYTAAQAAAGRQALQNNAFGACTDCHTMALTGRKGADGELPALSSLPAGAQQRIRNGGTIPPLVGAEFLRRWTSRSTRALTAEFRRRFADTLSVETRLDLVACILQMSGAAAGSEPLTMETDVEIGRLTGDVR